MASADRDAARDVAGTTVASGRSNGEVEAGVAPGDGQDAPLAATQQVGDARVAATGKRYLGFVEVVEALRTQLDAIMHAPHEEHAGPFCPICGLIGNLRKTLEDYSDA